LQPDGTLAAEIGYELRRPILCPIYGMDAVTQIMKASTKKRLNRLHKPMRDVVKPLFCMKIQSMQSALLPVTRKDIIAGFTFKMPMFYGFD